MNDQICPEASADQTNLASRIERLLRERGWNVEDFARHAELNRQTVRQLLKPSGNRKVRNARGTAAAWSAVTNRGSSFELVPWPACIAP